MTTMRDCMLALIASLGAGISSDSISYTMYNFTTRIDHFNYRSNATYQMRYAVSDKYWSPNKGPIFFNTGNEKPVETIILNTGLMWEWAPEFRALLVFAEHRYYGQSLPFGEQSFQDPEYSGFLTSEQALADYTDLILWLKRNIPGAEKSKVVSFGGSYGGMLSTFLRMKYPHVVDAAVASSAPFRMFPNLTSCETFLSAITAAFEKSSPGCAEIVSDTWPILDKYGSTQDGCRTLQDIFRTCQPLDTSNYSEFRDWIRDQYTTLAVYNYPYPSNETGPLPAYPIKTACSFLRNGSNGTDISVIAAVAEVINIFNTSGTKTCNDLHKSESSKVWSFQLALLVVSSAWWTKDGYWSSKAMVSPRPLEPAFAFPLNVWWQLGKDYKFLVCRCTEFAQPVGADGVSDMFYATEWNPQKYSAHCQDMFGVTPEFNKMVEAYPIPKLPTASKIFFSNGELDPWGACGLNAAPTPETEYLLIRGAAHHADLQFSREDEPQSFAAAREAEKNAIRKWIS